MHASRCDSGGWAWTLIVAGMCMLLLILTAWIESNAILDGLSLQACVTLVNLICGWLR
jgi:hypothetical protein